MRASATYAWCDQCGEDAAPAPPPNEQFSGENGYITRIFSPRQRGQIVHVENGQRFRNGNYFYPHDMDRLNQQYICSIHRTPPRFVRQYAAWQRRFETIARQYETYSAPIEIPVTRRGVTEPQIERQEMARIYRLRRPPPTTLARTWPNA